MNGFVKVHDRSIYRGVVINSSECSREGYVKVLLADVFKDNMFATNTLFIYMREEDINMKKMHQQIITFKLDFVTTEGISMVREVKIKNYI